MSTVRRSNSRPVCIHNNNVVSSILGRLDQIVDGVASGWVYNAGAVGQRLIIELTVDERPVLSVTADVLRSDLLDYGIGDGRHAFVAKLPVDALDGRAHVVKLFESTTKTLLAAETDIFVLERPAHPKAPTGCFDCVTDGVAKGWAYKPDQPEKRVQVEVVVDGKVVAQTVANKFRPDLREAAIGDGHHAFEARLPSYLLDSEIHQVEVINTDTRQPVLSAMAVTKLLPPIGTERGFDQNELYILFDANFYRTQAGNVSEPLRHYGNEGWKQNFDPHPLFDTAYYMALYGAELIRDPLWHFFAIGRWNNYHTHPLFDNALYCRMRPDVPSSVIHPLIHYLRSGYKEMVVPSRFFDEVYYLAQNPGVRETGFIPLVHYLMFGWTEDRRPHHEFDPLLFGRMANIPKNKEPLTHFARHLLIQRSTERRTTPGLKTLVSVVILNLSKSLMTLQCLYVLEQNTDMSQVEIIIVDNGSPADRFALLCEYGGRHQIIRLSINRGFGEANNVAADLARGEFLLFLNNDAFVTPGWLPPLLQAFATEPRVGAAGPKFLYPDGRLQEAGGMIAPCGTVLQRGKAMDGSFSLYDMPGPNPVDYCSAATLLIRTESFRTVLGFDLCWDPAYYEDVDICLKLRLIGQMTVYVPTSIIVHIENGTSSDQVLDLRLHDIVGTNRLKFVSRWSRYLSHRSNGTDERKLIPQRHSQPRLQGLPRLALYTPYELTPGGGERYLLSVAASLRDRYACTLLTPERYSRARLDTMARELELELDHVELGRLRDAPGMPTFDVYIAMGNEILPSTPGIGRLNFYLCQFPFPLEPVHLTNFWDNLATYNAFVCYSEFASWHIAKAMDRYGLGLKQCHVLSPPVPQVGIVDWTGSKADAPLVILNVGRFFSGGHCKRQDVMIEEFRKLIESSPRPVELHLAGSVGGDAEARGYLLSLQDAARGSPIFFHLNAMPEQLHNLYRRASIYWHLTGINHDLVQHPERFEHFGITVAEAMSAGVIPVVLEFGGPAEIITNGWNGFLIANRTELRERTLQVLQMSGGDLQILAARARERARLFAPDRFKEAIENLLTQETA